MGRMLAPATSRQGEFGNGPVTRRRALGSFEFDSVAPAHEKYGRVRSCRAVLRSVDIVRPDVDRHGMESNDMKGSVGTARFFPWLSRFSDRAI